MQLKNNSRQRYTRKDEEHKRIKSRVKHPFKVNTRAGISYEDDTPVKIFDGKVRMNSKMYWEIIHDYYIPFAASAYYLDSRIAQDNDPKHKSKYTTKMLET
ncbi:hypothetical protein OESDEN_19759 [Oesophagostomum dentatum]|uniref:PiggyBac transposable element-derived protein domain-containing protein n=1 Tax=Oesophagostomum dentatum TaxID=61180 RepID=A0A0B1S6L5_OESDE|nr:hypothetical protein OESDEN_19759 [Oesophagostomum dentatum]